MPISISEANTRAAVKTIFPTVRILTADRHKVLSCLCGWQLCEATMASCWVVAIGGHLTVVVEDLVVCCFVLWLPNNQLTN